MSFHVGQRVVCIDDRFQGGYGIEALPRKSHTYTIRGVRISGWEGCPTCVVLEEILNQPRQYRNGFHEAHFDARGFRPVIERKTDISVFTALLNPKPARKREAA